MVVGLGYDGYNSVSMDAGKKLIKIEKENNAISKVTFNGETASTEINAAVTYDSGSTNTNLNDPAKFTFIFKLGLTEPENVSCLFKNEINVIELNPALGTGISYVMYLTGSIVSAYDAWGNYSSDYVIIK